MFTLHPSLQLESTDIGDFPLSSVRLSNNANFPWVILVPRRANITEIYHLSGNDRQQLVTESCWVAEALDTIFSPDKLNIATIGNIVPQLHMHHICRYIVDPCWPNPVWGQLKASSYSNEMLMQTQRDIKQELADKIKF
jgi:diadenosine tetraphosphate (Ap4A) HIT family hydrolase